jgi:hypothetical protein
MDSSARQSRTHALLSAAAATVMALALLFAWAGSAQAKPPRDFFGVVPQAELSDHDFELMQRDGVGMVRQLFYWPGIEPERGSYNWSGLDAVMRRATAARIRVFPVLYGTPGWAQSAKRNRKCGASCGPGKSARDDFAAFAREAVERYGPGGAFWTDQPGPIPGCELPVVCRREVPCECTNPLPITAWQLWSEPNSPKYFGPRPRVGQYAQMFRAAAAKIESVHRGAEVITGGMWGPRGANGVIPTATYLRKLYRVNGMRRAIDSVAVHPYSSRFSKVKAQVRSVRNQVKRSGDGGAGMWVTELGWASGGPKRSGLVKNRQEQARLLRKSYRLLADNRGRWNVRSVHWYSWRDTGNRGICDWCPKSGLRTKNGGAKPAVRAFRRLAPG